MSWVAAIALTPTRPPRSTGYPRPPTAGRSNRQVAFDPMRLLIYGMQSSGASTLASVLAQKPSCAAFVDIWAMYAAPALPNAGHSDVVAKAVVTTAFPLAVHRERFQPDLTILFMRHPLANYRSLATKSYRHHCGFVEEKFAILNRTLLDQSGIDAVLYYEDLIFEPLAVLDSITRLGWACEPDFLQFRRTPEQIRQHNRIRFPFLAGRLEYGFGNHRDFHVSAEFADLSDLEDSSSPVWEWCPDVAHHYRALMQENRQKWTPHPAAADI
jgi:hypothetical protein